MGKGLLQRTRDIPTINQVLTHPDIWPNIADDEPDGYIPPTTEDFHYLHSDGMVLILHPHGDDWELHVNILPERRGLAFEATQEAIRYGFNQLGANRLIARIPPEYKSVYHFALKNNFTDHGVRNGEHFMKLEREKWALLEK